MLLCHLALLVFGLHHTALRAEVAHLAVEDGILAELALQTTVVDGYLDRGLQTYLVEAFLAIREHPSLVAHELVLETLAYHLVGGEQVGGRDAFAVRRIGHHDALVGRLGKVLEVGILYGDVLGESGGTHVQTRGVHRLHIHIITIDVVFELALARVVIVDAVEEVGVEVGPLLKGKLLAEDTRADVAGYQCCLDQQRARSTHGVYEVTLALPACHEYHAGCQHLVQRCLYALLTVATAVQRLAARVEAEGCVVFGDMDMQTDIRVGHRDVGAVAGLFSELVDNGILDLIGYEAGVAEFL